MSRTLKLVLSISFAVILFYLVAAFASAQSPRGRQPQQKPARPAAPNNRVPTLSPELEQILIDWSNATKGIKKLESKHRRRVYDSVFNVEKRAEGFLYYEAPDKGRIDLSPARIKKGEVSRQIDKRTKKPFKLEPDRSQQWICNGRDIRQINKVDKTVEVFPIPPDLQGRNIINGPLPFLFGMPPQKAKMRYEFELRAVENGEVWLNVKPRFQRDLANWREARVILVKKNRYLPRAVQLIDPTGNRKTVYIFGTMKINPKKSFLPWKEKDPFNPRIPRGYKLVTKAPPGKPLQKKITKPIVGRTGNGVVPNVVNLPLKNALESIERAGYEVKWKKGRKAPKRQLIRVVYHQDPKPKTTLPKGRKITLWWYADPKPARTAGKR